MSADDRVKVLEGEFKLIKSELRQTLSSVRDFLLDLKIPQIQENVNKQDEKQQPQPQFQPVGDAGPTSDTGSDQPFKQEPAFDSSNSGFGPQASPVQDNPDDLDMPQSSPDEFQPVEEPDGFEPMTDEVSDETGMTSGDIPDEEKSAAADRKTGEEEEAEATTGEAKSVISQVNLLSNLIRWVSSAKKEIGASQLPVFLDVYATTGTLTQEIRDTILYLAEVATDPVTESDSAEKKSLITEEVAICMEINGFTGQLPPGFKERVHRLTELILRQSVYGNTSNAWSVLILELHGILNGGGASLQPLAFIQNGLKAGQAKPGEDTGEESAECEDTVDDFEEIEEAPPAKYTKPARLRLVLPIDNGAEQELDLGSLFISAEPAAKTEVSARKNNGQKNIVSRKR
ncbi:MAG: hypothetical protein JXA46_12875 [Dehalococcoidales bacterium]|nr:hypothetical protein [Dehalococcoidales bacterium]